MDISSVLFFVLAAFIAHKLTSGWGAKKGKGRKKTGLFGWGRGKKSRAKSSWYWGNKKWTEIRVRRKEENRRRYGLPAGTCRCERCGEDIKGKDIHCDHIYPRKYFPALQYRYWNTQILCSNCNLMKSCKRGYNWRRLRQLKLHVVVWYLRNKQIREGERT